MYTNNSRSLPKPHNVYNIKETCMNWNYYTWKSYKGSIEIVHQIWESLIITHTNVLHWTLELINRPIRWYEVEILTSLLFWFTKHGHSTTPAETIWHLVHVQMNEMIIGVLYTQPDPYWQEEVDLLIRHTCTYREGTIVANDYLITSNSVQYVLFSKGIFIFSFFKTKHI